MFDILDDCFPGCLEYEAANLCPPFDPHWGSQIQHGFQAWWSTRSQSTRLLVLDHLSNWEDVNFWPIKMSHQPRVVCVSTYLWITTCRSWVQQKDIYSAQMEEDTHAPHRSRYARAWHQTWKIGCNTLLIQFFRYWYIIVFINPSRNDSILFPNIVFSPFLCQRKHFITDAFEDFIAKLHHVSPCHSVQEALLPIWASQKTFLSPNDPSIHHNDHHHLLSWISWQLITST